MCNLNFILRLLAYISFISMVGCFARSDSIRPQQIDPNKNQPYSGLGIESSDIIKLTQRMYRDLEGVNFHQGDEKPKIVIDDKRFINESSEIINVNLFLDRLRINLTQSARGKMVFISRENLDLVIEEAKASGRDFDILQADYRLVGRISSISTASDKSGVRTNFFQFTFEMLNLSDGTLVWGNIYEVKKLGSDDTIYR